jgi:hypothetical protein
LELTNSVVTITDSTIGGFGPAGAILLNGGDTRVLDGTIALVWGFGPLFLGAGGLRIDPSTTFINSNPPSYGPGLVPVIQPMPSLAATDAIIPGAITAHLADPIGDLAILLIGFPSAPILMPGITDAFWLDPTSYFFFAVGTAPLSSVEPVPANVGLRGLRVAWQGVTYGTALGMQASNPVVSLLH